MDYVKAKLYKTVSRGRDDWFVLFSQRNPVTGEMETFKVRKGINRIKSKRERTAFGNKIAEDINKLLKDGHSFFGDEYEAPEILPLRETMEHLIQTKRSTMRHRTWQTYVNIKDRFLDWLDENGYVGIMPNMVTKKIAFQYCDYMLTELKHKGTTFNGNRGILITYFNEMVEREIIGVNPFKTVPRRPVTEGVHRAFTEDQRILLRNWMQKNDPEYLDFVEPIYYLFLRPLEVLQLRLRDIMPERGIVMVWSGVGKNRRQTPKYIPNAYREKISHTIEVLKTLGKYNESHYLFSKDNLKPGAEPMHRNRTSDRFRKICRKINGQHGKVVFGTEYTCYSFKHTGMSDAKRANISNHDLMRQAGHSNEKQTETYTRSLGVDPISNFIEKMPTF